MARATVERFAFASHRINSVSRLAFTSGQILTLAGGEHRSEGGFWSARETLSGIWTAADQTAGMARQAVAVVRIRIVSVVALASEQRLRASSFIVVIKVIIVRVAS